MEKLNKLILERSYYDGKSFNLSEEEVSQALTSISQMIPNYLIYKGLSTRNKDVKVGLLKQLVEESKNISFDMEIFTILLLLETFDNIEKNDYFSYEALKESMLIIKTMSKEEILLAFNELTDLPFVDLNNLFETNKSKITEFNEILEEFKLTRATKDNIAGILQVIKTLTKKEDSFEDKILIIMYLEFLVNMSRGMEQLESIKLDINGRADALPNAGSILDVLKDLSIDLASLSTEDDDDDDE